VVDDGERSAIHSRLMRKWRMVVVDCRVGRAAGQTWSAFCPCFGFPDRGLSIGKVAGFWCFAASLTGYSLRSGKNFLVIYPSCVKVSAQ
jgi:hypothetical protein